jgi:hypothetical protein
MHIKIRFLIGALALSMTAGCRTEQVPSKPESFVGTYVYTSVDTSVDKPTDHELDRLTLQADGKYVLIQGGSTKAKSETVGIWRLATGSPPEVLLDHHGYPIRVKRNEIRLLINDDLGEWYAKTK